MDRFVPKQNPIFLLQAHGIFFYIQFYKSTYNEYTEYRFDINFENDAKLGILVYGKIPIEIDTVLKYLT